jgi:hypothetical protein
MRNVQVGMALVLTLVSLALSGCGQSGRVSVTGKVTLDSAPLQTGTVAFFPVAQGPGAYASIQSDGSYTAQTGTQPGLAPGDYVVTVQAMSPPPPPTPQNPEPLPVSLLPAKYSAKETSGLRCTVPAGGTTFDIPLTSK